MTEGVQRDLGRLEAQMENVADKLNKLEVQVEIISRTLSEAKGGWKMLMLVSGASATIGGLIAKFAPYISSMGPR